MINMNLSYISKSSGPLCYIRQFSSGALALTFLILLSGFSVAKAQNPVDILEADSIVGGTANGEQIRRILGNVYLKSTEQNLEMYCDSAYQFLGSSEIRAFGDIQINTANEKIWADSLVYFTDIDFSQLRGRVIIEADSTTLFGNSVDYRFTTKVAHFIDQIRLEDQSGILSAHSGFYFREADSAVFRGMVQLRDSLQYLEGDSLFSNRKSKYYEIYGDIFAHNRDDNNTLKGEYLEADSTGRRLLTGNAWLRNVNEDTSRINSKDSLALSPDTLSLHPDSLAGRPDSLSQTLSPDTAFTKTRDISIVPDSLQFQHIVRSGETLFSIAQNYNVSMRELKKWNKLSGNNLSSGHGLIVLLPADTRVVFHSVKAEETLFSISRQYEVSVKQLKSWNNLEDNNLIVGSDLKILKKSKEDSSYTVRQGDTLFSIAKSHNMSVDELKRINNLSSDTIPAGRQLIVKMPPTAKEVEITSPYNFFNISRIDTTASENADTTHIQAKKILSEKSTAPDDSSTIVNAYENVRIWSNKFSAISDTSRYDEQTEMFELWSKPKSWHKDVQLTGPYIKVILEDGDVNRLESYPDPFVVQQDTTIDRLNQIKGDTLYTYFEDGDLSRIHVFGNSQLLRYTKNEAENPDGAVLLNAPSIRIFFEAGELTELKADGPYNGSYLPESEQTTQRRLDGFVWTPDLRPQRPEQNMEPRFPPIPRERPFKLPRRYIKHIESETDDTKI